MMTKQKEQKGYSWEDLCAESGKDPEARRVQKCYFLIVAVPERSLHENAAVPEGYLVYKTALKPGAVLEALEGVRTGQGAPEDG
jgi:hypothetical protein